MKILFCNITYMNHYIGNIEKDKPKGGGAWVEKHKDAHEKWNFLNVDGRCYGFVQNMGDQFHIERLEGVSKQDLMTENVTVIWCSRGSKDETVIVGWYENATIYRHYQFSVSTPIGLDRCYFAVADAADCYLLPEEQRTYAIGRASAWGKGYGFGESNFWYADSEVAKTDVIPAVLDYLHSHRTLRINRTNEAFLPRLDATKPLSATEEKLADGYFNIGEYHAFLSFGYRAFHNAPTADNAYNLAYALKELHQYSSAIDWYRKVIELEGESWEVNSSLPYLLMECGRHEEAIAEAEHLLTFPEAEDINARCELYGILADNNHNLGKILEAISYLNRILAESTDPDLIAYAKQTKECWESL